MEQAAKSAKIAGTFAQEVPGPGATWHVVTIGNITNCSQIVTPAAEWWTTDQMPAFKVCEPCRRKALTLAFMSKIDAIMAARAMLTLAEAAARLGLSPSTLRGQIGKGRLRARLIGKTWTVSEREVERYRAESLGKIGRPSK